MDDDDWGPEPEDDDEDPGRDPDEDFEAALTAAERNPSLCRRR